MAPEAGEQEHLATCAVAVDSPIAVYTAQAPPGVCAGVLLAQFGAPPGCAIFQGGYILGNDNRVTLADRIVVLNAEDVIVHIIHWVLSCVGIVLLVNQSSGKANNTGMQLPKVCEMLMAMMLMTMMMILRFR